MEAVYTMVERLLPLSHGSYFSCISIPYTLAYVREKGVHLAVAIPRPGHLREAIEELGDLVFYFSRKPVTVDICSYRGHNYLCIYGFVNPCNLLGYIREQVPAYITRIYPLCCVLNMTSFTLRASLRFLSSLLRSVNVSSVGLNVVMPKKGGLYKRIEKISKKELEKNRLQVKYRARVYIHVMYLGSLIAGISVTGMGYEKVSYWRRQRLDKAL